MIKDPKAFKKFLEKKIEFHNSLLVTEEQVLEMLNEEVFTDLDFKRQVLEVSLKTKISEENAMKVIKHFLTKMAIQMVLPTRYRQRMNIFCFFMIEINVIQTLFTEKHEAEYIKHYGKRFTQKILSIFKN